MWTRVEEVALLSVLVLCPILYSYNQSSFLVPKETYAAVAIAVACIARCIAAPIRPVLNAGWFGLALASYTVVSAISIAWSVSWYWSVRSTVGVTVATAFFVLAAERCRFPGFIGKGLASIAISGVVVAALSIMQLAGPARLLFPRFPGNPQTMYSTFGNDSFVAGYLVIAAPLVVGYIVADRYRRRRSVAVWTCAALMVIYALLALQTRSAWFALCVACLCTFGAVIRTGRLVLVKEAVRPLTIVICGLALFAAVQSAIPGTTTGSTSLVARIRAVFDRSQPAVADRVKMTLAAEHMIRDQPLAGAGAGTFGFLAPKYQGYVFEKRGRPPALTPSQQSPFLVHNEYLQTVAELGVLGFLLVLAMFVAGAREVARVLHATDSDDRQANLLVCGGTGTILATAVFATAHFPFRIISHALAFLFTMAAFYGYYSSQGNLEQQVYETSRKRALGLHRWPAVAVSLVSLSVGTAAVWNLTADRMFWKGYTVENELPGETATALRRLESAAHLDPFRGRISAACGWALANRGRWTDAEPYLDRARGSWDTAAVNYNLAVVSEELGRTDDAVGFYQAALYRNPGLIEAKQQLAVLTERERAGSPSDTGD